MTTKAEALAALDLAREWIAAQDEGGAPPPPPPPPPPPWPVTLPANRGANWFCYGVLIDTDNGCAWVSSNGWDSISGAYGSAKVERFSLTTGTKESEVSLGAYPAHGAGRMVKWGGDLFVLDQHSGEVCKIAVASMSVVARRSIGSGHVLRGICQHNGELFASNSNASSVYVIDPASMTTLATIPVSGDPRGSCVANGKIYVACFSANCVRVIDPVTRAVVATIAIPSGIRPCNVTTDPVNGRVYVFNYGEAGVGGDSISVIDPATNTVIATWGVLTAAGLHEGRRVGNVLWVTCSRIHYLQGINVNTGASVGSFQTPRDPAFMDAIGNQLWVPCALDNILQVRQV